MIQINGSEIELDMIKEQYPAAGIGRTILDQLYTSSKIYRYRSISALKFEVDLRIHIVDAAKELYRSGFSFKTFRNSKCNEVYWKRTDEGGFLLKEAAKPSKGIGDIYTNGSKYGTECATAIVIVFYKAVCDLYPEPLFDKIFQSIYLMDWRQPEGNLDILYYREKIDHLPGDCRYFKNPDVNPETPEWQGENAIDLGNGTYYGHGLGIKTADEMLEALNRHRKKDPERPAYLTDSATRPDFENLSTQYFAYHPEPVAETISRPAKINFQVSLPWF